MVPGSEKHRILYVEDNPHVRDIIVMFLERGGHKVETADTGLEAFEKFQGNRGNYDLIIADRALPFMTGDELVLRIKKLNPKLPVIMLSGTITEDTAPQADIVLMKPVTMEDLQEAIVKAMRPQAA
ncbi:MAG: response regulator [Candidatus Omnitrophica bacterium]|nr:response regulator [Candidatus Omnitrophota bacterium]